MKLFTCKQIGEIDRLTMQLEPIASIDLMERAATCVANWMLRNIHVETSLCFFAGPGNNGGDALAVARLMAGANFQCTVFLVSLGRELKGDPAINLQRLKEQKKATLCILRSVDDLTDLHENTMIIDGLFGSGLNKPLDGLAAEIVGRINRSGAKIISIDVPSGLFGENNTQNKVENIVRAHQTLTFQFPKLSFLFADNAQFVGECKVLPIGLHSEAIAQTETNYFLQEEADVSAKLVRRNKFAHKGVLGHALLIAGSYGKMGAAVLASEACLRSGAGLLTSHVPQCGCEIMQNSVPESMVSVDSSEVVFSQLPELSLYSAIGIGPGVGKKKETAETVRQLLQAKPSKLVMDADALNILSEHPDWYGLLPSFTILTPHPKEFGRLAGTSANSYERLQKQLEFSSMYQVIVVLKGAYTCITLPDGRVFFNSTGNPGMATAGSGDVLTGIILGLLAQNYTSEDAALMGVYLHGLAGDLAAEHIGEYSLIAGDIIRYLGKAFKRLV
jgi:ADP-dependent NAD(P)H-hydrate dehydratase / NAD(P)H-hydrate epimerase